MNTLNKPILVADGHGIVRHGMINLIKEISPRAVLFEATDFKATIDQIIAHKPMLLIIDNNIRGSEGIKMLNAIKSVQPELKTLIFSASDEQIYAIRYIQAGARGYLSKHSSANEIKAAINTLMGEEIYVSQPVKDSLLYRAISNEGTNFNPLKNLSMREFEVAKLLVSGMSVSEIAHSLNLQLSTISTFKNRIFNKLGIQNVVHLLEVFNLYNPLTALYA